MTTNRKEREKKGEYDKKDGGKKEKTQNNGKWLGTDVNKMEAYTFYSIIIGYEGTAASSNFFRQYFLQPFYCSRTEVPLWEDTTQILSSLSRKRDCSFALKGLSRHTGLSSYLSSIRVCRQGTHAVS